MNILVSACLLGVGCRPDGGTNGPNPAVTALMEQHHLIPVCPEQLGGLPTPRPEAERRGSLVATKGYRDLAEEFDRGAEETLNLARVYHCKYAILKELSPSCGSGKIYDGTFHNRVTEGYGVTAALLTAYGITVLGESQVPGYRFEE